VRLTVSTPLGVITDSEGIAHVRAEDETGAFGILPGHADFLTALSLSVVSWRDLKGREHHLAVRGGMLEVRDGQLIAIATREAIAGEDLGWLQTEVVAAFRRRTDVEKKSRTDAQRLYLAAIRQIYRYLRPHTPAGPGGSTAQLEDLEK
jgi:F-type H+-transporting ATPase subunit epsilon